MPLHHQLHFLSAELTSINVSTVLPQCLSPGSVCSWAIVSFWPNLNRATGAQDKCVYVHFYLQLEVESLFAGLATQVSSISELLIEHGP